MCIAPIAGESPVVVGVGGAFWGCFGGGALGAIAGVAMAGLNWCDRDWPKQRTVFTVLTVVAGWLILLVLGFVLMRQIWPGTVTYIPSFLEAVDLQRLLVAGLLLLIVVVGTPTGLWLGQRVDRFIRPAAKSVGDV
jgi:hypothetical protein